MYAEGMVPRSGRSRILRLLRDSPCCATEAGPHVPAYDPKREISGFAIAALAIWSRLMSEVVEIP